MNTRHRYTARRPFFLALLPILLLHMLLISLSAFSASEITAEDSFSPGLLAPTSRQDPPKVGQIQDASFLRGSLSLTPGSLTAGNEAAQSEPYSITLQTTVGLNPHECASQPILSVAPGTEVVYCYFVTNNGTEDLTFHTVENNQRGPLLTNVTFPLVAGSSALVTTTVPVTETTVHVGTWSSTDGANSILASDSSAAKVYVNALTIEPSIGLPNESCLPTGKLAVNPNTEVVLCYRLVNNSDLPLSTHALRDSQSGELISALSYLLAPGESVTTKDLGLTLVDMVTNTTLYTFTWRASTIALPPEIPGDRLDAPITLTANATTAALTPDLSTRLTVGLEADTCAETTELTVFAGTEVVFCYYAHNTGSVTFTHHTVLDNFPIEPEREAGTSGTPGNSDPITRSIVNNTQYEMPPDGLGQFTNAQKAYTSTVVTMEWSAFSSNALSTTTAIDASRIRRLSTLKLPAPIVSATATSQVTVTVLPLAEINITVYEDANQNSVQDAGEVGIPNATVLLASDDTQEPLTAQTDNNGIATFKDVSPAIYNITVLFEAPLQSFDPVGSGLDSLLLRSGTNQGLALGYQRNGPPPEFIYIPVQVSR